MRIWKKVILMKFAAMIIAAIPIAGCANSEVSDEEAKNLFKEQVHKFDNWLIEKGLTDYAVEYTPPVFSKPMPIGNLSAVYKDRSRFNYGLTRHFYHLAKVKNKMNLSPKNQSAYVVTIFALYLADSYSDSSKGFIRRSMTSLEVLRLRRADSRQFKKWKKWWRNMEEEEKRRKMEFLEDERKILQAIKKAPPAQKKDLQNKYPKMKKDREIWIKYYRNIMELEKVNEKRYQKELKEAGKKNAFINTVRRRQYLEEATCWALTIQKLREYYTKTDITGAIARVFNRIDKSTTLSEAVEMIGLELEKVGVDRKMINMFYEDYAVLYHGGLRNEQHI